MELIASVLSKVLSSNDKLSAEPRRRSTRPLLMVVAFRPRACSNISRDGSNTRDISSRCQLRQALDNHSRSETDFQYAVVQSDFKKFGDPCAALLICVRHDDATQPPQDPLRAPTHVHENVSHDAHRLLRRSISASAARWRALSCKWRSILCSSASRHCGSRWPLRRSNINSIVYSLASIHCRFLGRT
jgi:hypothetical protein